MLQNSNILFVNKRRKRIQGWLKIYLSFHNNLTPRKYLDTEKLFLKFCQEKDVTKKEYFLSTFLGFLMADKIQQYSKNKVKTHDLFIFLYSETGNNIVTSGFTCNIYCSRPLPVKYNE